MQAVTAGIAGLGAAVEGSVTADPIPDRTHTPVALVVAATAAAAAAVAAVVIAAAHDREIFASACAGAIALRSRSGSGDQVAAFVSCGHSQEIL